MPEVARSCTSCVSAGALSSFGQPAAGTSSHAGATTSSTGVVTSSSAGSTASALLRTLSRRRRRSSASATMSSSTSTSSTSSSSLLVPRQQQQLLDLSDDRRLREPASVSSISDSSSTFGLVVSGDVGETVERRMMTTEQWRRSTPTCRHLVAGVTLPSDVEETTSFARHSSITHTQSATQRITFHATGIPTSSQSAAWHQDHRHRLDLPPTATPSLPEVTLRTRRRPQSPPTSPFQMSSSRCRQNGDSLTSSPVRRSGEWSLDEQRPSACSSEEESLTSTKAVTSTASDVWRPY